MKKMGLFFIGGFLTLLSVSTQARTTLKNGDFSTMIIGGDTARLGQFPYQIQISDEATLEFCGASLARVQGTQVVITSAQNVASYSPSDILLRGGVLNWDEDNFLIQSRNPSRIIVHPDFDPMSLQNDIALIFFSVPFLRTQNVNWVSLPERFEEVAPRTNVTVTGWGQQSEDWGDYTFLLQYVEIPVVSNEQCNASWVEANGTEILDSQLCTSDSNGIASPCLYDGGGPAVTGEGILAGIVSWGKDDCANTDTHPSVYTKVSHFIDWIEATVQNYQNSQL